MSTINKFSFEVILNGFKTLWNLQGEVKDLSDVNLRSGVVENVKIINNEFVRKIPNFTGIQVTENDYDKFLQHVYSRIYTFTSIVYLEEIELLKSDVDDFIKCGSIENFREYKEVFENITYLLLMMDILLCNNKLKDIIDEIQKLRKTIKEKVGIPEKKEVICLIWKKLVELEELLRENNSIVNKSNQNEEFLVEEVEEKTEPTSISKKTKELYLAALKKKTEEWNIEEKKLNDDLNQLKTENTQLTIKNANLCEEDKKTKKRIGELETANQRFKSEIEQLQKSNEKMNGIELQRKVNHLETTIKKLTTENDLSKKRIQELERENGRIKRENDGNINKGIQEIKKKLKEEITIMKEQIKKKMKENTEKIGRIAKEKYVKKDNETEEKVIEKAEMSYEQIIITINDGMEIMNDGMEIIEFIKSVNESIHEIIESYQTNQNEIDKVKNSLIDKIIGLEELKMNRDLKLNPSKKNLTKGIFEDKKDIWNERRKTNESIYQIENVEVRIPIAYYLSSTPFVCEYQGNKITIPITPDTNDGDILSFDIETNEDKLKLNCHVYCLTDGIYQRDGLNLIVTLTFSKEYNGIKTIYPLQIGNREAIPLEFEIKEGIIYESNDQGLVSQDGRKGSLKVIIQLA